MKVVLDTNVLVSGLMLPDSVPGKIVSAWRKAHFELLVCQSQLDEISRVLSYPKIKRRLGWEEDMVKRFVLLLRLKASFVDLKGHKVTVTNKLRDQADAHVLATLVVGKADVLVTGDKDLLALGAKYNIVNPFEFSRRL